jgi:hypothetical protein
MNQRQQQVIEYLLEENRVLREQIGNRRNAIQRCSAVPVGRQRIEAWPQNPGSDRDHRDTGNVIGLASEADCTKVRWERKPGSRPVKNSKQISDLVVRMAEENRTWGYRRIQGAIANVGHILAHSTILIF